MLMKPAATPRNPSVSLVIVGSVGLDDIATPCASRRNLLGGSACYACAAASFFAAPGLVGVVGRDFPARGRARLEAFGVDCRGLRQASGRTFRWSGVYDRDMNSRRTLSTELNVFADFEPDLPPAYRAAPYLFLANIAPALQLRVLSQMRAPRFVAADTMDLWIRTARAGLLRVIRRVDLLLLNDSEARALAGVDNLVAAARRIRSMGPRYVIIKKGEHGSLLAAPRALALVPAFPLETVRDPTGAGDAFAGGLMGRLAAGRSLSAEAVRKAMVYGTLVASFAVESFSLDRLQALELSEIEARARQLRAMVRL